jgi:hypothetical protein
VGNLTIVKGIKRTCVHGSVGMENPEYVPIPFALVIPWGFAIVWEVTGWVH